MNKLNYSYLKDDDGKYFGIIDKTDYRMTIQDIVNNTFMTTNCDNAIGGGVKRTLMDGIQPKDVLCSTKPGEEALAYCSSGSANVPCCENNSGTTGLMYDNVTNSFTCPTETDTFRYVKNVSMVDDSSKNNVFFKQKYECSKINSNDAPSGISYSTLDECEKHNYPNSDSLFTLAGNDKEFIQQTSFPTIDDTTKNTDLLSTYYFYTKLITNINKYTDFPLCFRFPYYTGRDNTDGVSLTGNVTSYSPSKITCYGYENNGATVSFGDTGTPGSGAGWTHHNSKIDLSKIYGGIKYPDSASYNNSWLVEFKDNIKNVTVLQPNYGIDIMRVSPDTLKNSSHYSYLLKPIYTNIDGYRTDIKSDPCPEGIVSGDEHTGCANPSIGSNAWYIIGYQMFYKDSINRIWKVLYMANTIEGDKKYNALTMQFIGTTSGQLYGVAMTTFLNNENCQLIYSPRANASSGGHPAGLIIPYGTAKTNKGLDINDKTNGILVNIDITQTAYGGPSPFMDIFAFKQETYNKSISGTSFSKTKVTLGILNISCLKQYPYPDGRKIWNDLLPYRYTGSAGIPKILPIYDGSKCACGSYNPSHPSTTKCLSSDNSSKSPVIGFKLANSAGCGAVPLGDPSCDQKCHTVLTLIPEDVQATNLDYQKEQKPWSTMADYDYHLRVTENNAANDTIYGDVGIDYYAFNQHILTDSN